MFDWKSGDDEWEELPTAVTADKTPRFHLNGRGLLALAVLALLVAGGLWLAYRRVETQVTAVTNSREEEIRAADRLLVETAVAGDNELVAAFLSRSPAWTDTQIRLLTRGSFFDRPPLGLWLDTRADLFTTEFLTSTQSTTEFIFSPDLNSAELKMTMPYITLDEDGEMQPLSLQRTAVYRLQNNGWLLAEPDRAFWGDYVHEERPYLDLITPTRDRETAVRLADDLNGWIERICLDIACPQAFQLQLRLANDPQSLLELHSPVRFSTVYAGGRQTTRLSLPTPTLVGLPLDETGYQVLLRGYVTHLARALLNAYAFPAPAETGGVFTNPDIDGLLAQWGLMTPWPTGYNPIIAAAPPPIPLPEQDILMLCQGSRALNLFRYDMAAELWTDMPLETEGAPGYYLTPFPDGQGAALVVGPSTRDGLFRVVWLHDGRERLLFTTPAWPSVNSVTQLEPGRFLLSYNMEFADENGDNPGYRYNMIEMMADACDDETCAVQPFEKWVQPSPDGRYTLIMTPHETQQMVYALGNAAGEEIMALENAYYPIWLDGRTLAYLQSIPSNNPHQPSENKLMTAVITGDNSVEIENRLTMEEIRATLPDLPPTSQLYLAGMTSYPAAQPEQLFLSVFNWQGNMAQRGYLLQYDWQEHQWSSIDSEFVSASWGYIRQHGRYLTVGVYTNAGYAIHLYDIPNQRWQVYEVDNSRFLSGSPAAWSEDGNWFILLDSGLIRLVAPEHRYEKRLFHGLDYCATALLVDRTRRDEAGP